MKILLTCSTGMSSSLIAGKIEEILAKRLEKEALVRGIECHAIPADETSIKEKLGEFDVLMVAPQVSIEKAMNIVNGKAIVKPIKVSDYTLMNASNILDSALEAYN